MRFSDVFRLSLLQLRVNPLRTAFTLLGIVVSVGFLVAGVAIIQGMNAYVKENIADAMIDINTFQVRRFPISPGLFNDADLTAFMTDNIGRWGAEFERLTALNDLEL